jgi:hypothetical protein
MADKEQDVRKKVLDKVMMPDPEVSNMREKMKEGAEKVKGKIDEELMERVVQPLADAGHENVGAVAGALASAMADMAIPESPADVMPVPAGVLYKVGKGIKQVDKVVKEVPEAMKVKTQMEKAKDLMKAGGTPDRVVGKQVDGDAALAKELEERIGKKGSVEQKVGEK